MKKFALHIILLFVVGANSLSLAQKSDFKGYHMENDEIVFIFNKNEYNKVTNDLDGHQKKLEDLEIETVALSGNFNNWSTRDWPMRKVDENTYELRKKLEDFSHEFSWEFKFVINNKYWAEPSDRDANVVWATKDYHNLHVYNLKLYTAYPDKNGNVRFRLRGYEDAKKVILSGTFNRWNEQLFKMYKIENGWEIVLQLPPNEYEYRFIVDGRWMEDPTNPDKVVNEYGEYNSHIDVKKMVTFQLKGFSHAKKVVLAGSFNDWDEHNTMQKNENDIWEYSLPLSGGKHHYKFIVDGQWLVDPNNAVKEYDSYGHINSVYMVR
ncbi:MAG TPA: hypothetical protein VKZ98_09485 [Aquaticitalea sp.]|nr:hypothetical protein [Aquaticitalea sp.]